MVVLQFYNNLSLTVISYSSIPSMQCYNSFIWVLQVICVILHQSSAALHQLYMQWFNSHIQSRSSIICLATLIYQSHGILLKRAKVGKHLRDQAYSHWRRTANSRRGSARAGRRRKSQSKEREIGGEIRGDLRYGRRDSVIVMLWE